MKYDIIKDGNVVVTLDTIEEARALLKLLGYGYELRPSKGLKKNNCNGRAGRWHI